MILAIDRLYIGVVHQEFALFHHITISLQGTREPAMLYYSCSPRLSYRELYKTSS